MDILIGSYPKVGKDAIIQHIHSLLDAKDTMVGKMHLFEDGRNMYQDKMETALDKQQRLLDGMVRLMGFELGMRTLGGLAGVPDGVQARGPDLPRDPAPEALLRRVKTLRTVMEDVRPIESRTESIPYGPPRVDPGVLPFTPEFSASVMLGEKTPEKGSGIGTPELDTREGRVQIDMSSPPTASTFGATAASAACVHE